MLTPSTVLHDPRIESLFPARSQGRKNSHNISCSYTFALALLMCLETPQWHPLFQAPLKYLEISAQTKLFQMGLEAQSSVSIYQYIKCCSL